MKKTICLLLCAVLIFSAALPAAAAGDHVHAGPLESLRTEAGLDTPCCGVFRCSACGETYEASVTPADVGMPIVKIEGSLAGISKENKVTVNVNYDDGKGVAVASSATLKWQGGSSVGYPKKNYNMQFVKANGSKNKVELTPAWGSQSKYTLKANWVDYSGARNVVSAKLWGEIVHARCYDDGLDGLVNGGGVDGYPVLLYHNGDFQGLYTLNTPKDNWIFGMDGSAAREGLLFGDTWTSSVMLQSLISDVNNPAGSGWDVEYCSTEDDPEVGVSWLGAGMNELIGFLLNNDGEALKAGLGNYTDVDRAIDYMLYIFFICAADNVGKNTLWATYDGVKYIPSAYDMDGTWGMYWDGSFPDLIPNWSSFSPLQGNLLFVRLLNNYPDEVKAHYVALREDVLSYRNIERQFSSFIGQIPAYVYAADAGRWPNSPNHDVNNLSQILQWAQARIDSLDALFDVTITEKTESAYRAAFACENGAKVFVYPTQDYTGEPVRAASAYSVNGATGELTKSDGQINFKVDVPEGWTATVEVSPADGYKNLKPPAETGEENVWRITKIKKDLTVRVRIDEVIPEPEGWNVNFVCDPGVTVLVYPGSDYTAEPEETMQTVSVESATGVPTKTDGQVNFTLAGENPLDAFEISVSPKNYKNLKGPDETGKENTWRVTKITGDITVNVTRIPHEHVWGEWEPASAATCAAQGSEKRTCACGEEETRPVDIDPENHAWGEWVPVKAATTAEEGLMQRTCRNDASHVETQVIPKKQSGASGLTFIRQIFDWLRWLIQRIRHFFHMD